MKRHKTPYPKEQARGIFNRAFLNGSVSYTSHCRKRMVERGVDANDLIGLARSGVVYKDPEVDITTGQWKYTIENPSTFLKVVFIVSSEKKIRLVTVMDKGR